MLTIIIIPKMLIILRMSRIYRILGFLTAKTVVMRTTDNACGAGSAPREAVQQQCSSGAAPRPLH